MPIYKVEDPASGRVVTLEGDSPPTEVELNEIFGNLPPAPAAPRDDSLGGRIGQQWSDVGKTMDEINQADQTWLESDLQRRGQLIAGAAGTAGELLSSAAGLAGNLVPDPIKQRFSETYQEFQESPEGQAIGRGIQKVADWYSEFAEENPRLARNLEAGGNIASAAPFGFPAKSSIKETGRQLKISAYKQMKNQKAKHINNILEPEDNRKNRDRYKDNYNEDEQWEPNERDEEIGESVFKFTDVDPKGSLVANRKSIEQGIANEAKRLEAKLDGLKIKVTSGDISNTLVPELKKISSADTFSGDSVQVLKKHVAWLKDKLGSKKEWTPRELLQLRRDYDDWVGESYFSATNPNFDARRHVTTTIRGTLNRQLGDIGTANGVDVKNSLRNQSNLYSAADRVHEKWLDQSDGFLRGVNKWLRSKTGIVLPSSPLALKATVGAAVGGVTAAQMGTLGLAGVIGYATARGATSPTIRKYLGEVLSKMPKELKAERAVIVELMKLPVGEEPTEEEASAYAATEGGM